MWEKVGRNFFQSILLISIVSNMWLSLPRDYQKIRWKTFTKNKTENAVSALRRRVRLTILTKNSESND